MSPESFEHVATIGEDGCPCPSIDAPAGVVEPAPKSPWKKDQAPARAAEAPYYLTLQEVARFLRISTRSVYRMVWDGDIKADRIGKLWRIPAANVPGYLDSRAK